jgi:hypothetical protein
MINEIRKNQKGKEKIVDLNVKKFREFHEKNSLLAEIKTPEILLAKKLYEKHEIVRIIKEDKDIILVKENDKVSQNIIIGLSMYNGEGFIQEIREDEKLSKYREEHDIIINVLNKSILNHINKEIFKEDYLHESSIIKKILLEDKEKKLLKMYFKLEKMYDEKENLNSPLSRELINELIERYSWDERFHRMCSG